MWLCRNDDEIVAVSDEESGYNYRLLSNSKRKLEKIGQELYDNHTAGCKLNKIEQEFWDNHTIAGGGNWKNLKFNYILI